MGSVIRCFPISGTVLDAYLTLTVLDAVTNAILPGTFAGPTDPSLGPTAPTNDRLHGTARAGDSIRSGLGDG